MKPAADNAPRNDTARILCACVCSLVALVLTAPSGGARAAAVPQSKEEQAKVWQEIATLPDFWQGTWLSISPIADDFPTPPDYTPSALDYIKRYKPVEDSPFANCQPLGLPFVMNIGGMPMKFFQSPGMIALYIESSGMTRFIHTDARQHSERPNPTYLGESIGHWEGDTLVVDSTRKHCSKSEGWTRRPGSREIRLQCQASSLVRMGQIFGWSSACGWWTSTRSRSRRPSTMIRSSSGPIACRRVGIFEVSSAETTRKSGLAPTTAIFSTRRPASWNTT
jgi:hypothetical protein